jgi:hypothetical protein
LRSRCRVRFPSFDHFLAAADSASSRVLSSALESPIAWQASSLPAGQRPAPQWRVRVVAARIHSSLFIRTRNNVTHETIGFHTH